MRFLGPLVLLGALVLAGCGKQEKSTPPNIIFIMSDDHAYQAISAYGSTFIETPHIDRIAGEGVRFDRAFVTNSICGPSRAVILTGKFSHVNGFLNNHSRFDASQMTFPKLLRKNGYKTAVVGKWHLGSDPTGFDFWRILYGQGVYYNPDFKSPQGTVKTTGYVSDVITDMAIDWIDSLKQGQPFMLMYHHKASHREWSPPPRYLGYYSDKAIPEPATLFDDYANRGRAAKEAEMRIREHMGLPIDNKIRPAIAESLGFSYHEPWFGKSYLENMSHLNAEEKAAWEKVYGPINEEFRQNTPAGDDLVRWKYRRYMEDYLATTKSIDDNIGRLLAYLDEKGLSENTLVIYTSDQGFFLGEHGWFDKRFMYEESFRTPLVMRWPARIGAGQTSADLVQNLDIAQTILDAAGVAAPPEMQGRSLLPLTRGEREQWRDAVYYHYYQFPSIHMVKRHYGVRTERYKLIHFYYDIDEWELYDLEKDPQEMNNVYEDPAYGEIREQLMEKLHELQAQYQDGDSLATAILERDLGKED